MHPTALLCRQPFEIYDCIHKKFIKSHIVNSAAQVLAWFHKEGAMVSCVNNSVNISDEMIAHQILAVDQRVPCEVVATSPYMLGTCIQRSNSNHSSMTCRYVVYKFDSPDQYQVDGFVAEVTYKTGDKAMAIWQNVRQNLSTLMRMIQRGCATRLIESFGYGAISGDELLTLIRNDDDPVYGAARQLAASFMDAESPHLSALRRYAEMRER